mgnify:FL=1
MILEQLKNFPETINFNDVIVFIDENYHFKPVRFIHGCIMNEANQNNSSCKIFSFAKMNNLSEKDTLALFGDFYRNDVLQNPEGEDHQNIRNFIKYGWNGSQFAEAALERV